MQEEQGCHADVHSEREGNNNSTAPRAIKWFFMAISGDSDFVFMFLRFARLPSHFMQSVQ
jgi:hypothetical protein